VLVLRFLVFWIVTLSSRVFDNCMSKECQESTTMLLSISTQKTSMLVKMCWEVQPFDIFHYHLHRCTDLRIIRTFMCYGNFGAVKAFWRRNRVHTFVIVIQGRDE